MVNQILKASPDASNFGQELAFYNPSGQIIYTLMPVHAKCGAMPLL